MKVILRKAPHGISNLRVSKNIVLEVGKEADISEEQYRVLSNSKDVKLEISEPAADTDKHAEGGITHG
jgi:hypothetical protein